MRLFLQYLRGKAGKIVAFFLFAVIFIVSFALYHLPLAAVWYPSALCVILGLAVLLLDFRRVKARHETLRLILCQLPTLPETLPAAHTVPEEDYRALVQALCAQQQALETRMNAQYQDMLDYYTLWAHQIKTPIASMRLCLQQEDTPQARRLLQELSRAEQYVEMVMVYLRLNGGSDLVLRECELDAIVRRAVRRFAGEFIGRKLKLCYEPLNVSCVTDEKWLLFVIEQILSNALKYTRAGSITIELEAPKTLVIRDTGIGVAPEDLPRIFEKGYTGYNGRGDQKASGLGLYLCRTICRKKQCSSCGTLMPFCRKATAACPVLPCRRQTAEWACAGRVPFSGGCWEQTACRKQKPSGWKSNPACWRRRAAGQFFVSKFLRTPTPFQYFSAFSSSSSGLARAMYISRYFWASSWFLTARGPDNSNPTKVSKSSLEAMGAAFFIQ